MNGGLWLINAVVVGVVCGGCAFTAAAWAAGEGVGLRDSNFGTVFSVWDRAFQTYTASDPAAKVETALAELLGDVTLPRALLLPLQR